MTSKRPDPLAQVLGYVAVALVVGWVGAKIFRSTGPGIAAGALGVVAHAMLDAPVSQAFSDLGF